MDDWPPSMYEAARRLLRTSGGALYVPDSCFDSAKLLILGISDEIPSIITEPSVNSGTIDEIFYDCDGKIEFMIGNNEPAMETCWIKSESNEIGKLWNDLSEVAMHLARAGYPGCLGCGGPGSDEIWDENVSRLAS